VPYRPIIKKEDLPADQVEPVTLDEHAFYKRRSRIPRERVQIDLSHPAPESGRYDYRQRSVLYPEETTFEPAPIAVPGEEHDAEASATGDKAPESPPPDASASEEETDEDETDPVAEMRVALEAEWSAKVEQAATEAWQDGFQSGYDVGYEDGFDDAEAKVGAQMEKEVETLAHDVAQLKSLWEQYIEESEPALVELAVEVAEALLDMPLPDSVRGASARAIAEAVEDLANAGSLTVTLHPVDYQRLQEKGMLDQLNANHEQTLRWNPDPEHAEGDWSVESPTALVRHHKNEILRAVKQRLGMSPPAVHDHPQPPSSDPDVTA
jgi:flagellar assembly protein FliH